MPRDFTSLIPLEVSNRVNRNGRVYYLLSGLADEPEMVIPEQIVLKRWRKLSSSRHTFHGCRLSPTMWRQLGAIDFEAADWRMRVQAALTNDPAKQSIDSTRSKLPSFSSLEALHSILGGERLGRINRFSQAMLERNRFGTPDLFLWITSKNLKRYTFGAFVEVKKPQEPVSLDQKTVLSMMRRLNVNAQVIRLRETA